MEVFVDVEGFYAHDKQFLAKEITILSLNDPTFDYLLTFKPPLDSYNGVILLPNKDFRRQSHSIPWDSGDNEYEYLIIVLTGLLQDAIYIYVLGADKVKWLSTFVNKPTIDVAKMHYINYLENNELNKKFGCTHKNVQRMKKWFKCHWSLSEEKSLQLFHQLQSLRKMSPGYMANLDVNFILLFANSEIREIWSKLPTRLQKDKRFINYLRCEEHYTSDDVIDNPYPYVKQ